MESNICICRSWHRRCHLALNSLAEHWRSESECAESEQHYCHNGVKQQLFRAIKIHSSLLLFCLFVCLFVFWFIVFFCFGFRVLLFAFPLSCICQGSIVVDIFLLVPICHGFSYFLANGHSNVACQLNTLAKQWQITWTYLKCCRVAVLFAPKQCGISFAMSKGMNNKKKSIYSSIYLS